MINAIDHVVILVNDLDAAIADYRALGFTVVPGGEHADGLSHNALISLADGSYLELIAFKRPPPDEHLFAQGYRAGEGLVTFALLPTDIANDLKEIRARGLEMDGPFPGGRMRPDGQRVEWQIATPRTPDLPFLCGDVTPRELRVPGREASRHANGATWIALIGVVVASLQESLERYRALLGQDSYSGSLSEPAEEDGSATFHIGKTTVILMESTSHMAERTEGPQMLALGADLLRGYGHLNYELAHGAHITITRPVLKVNSVAEQYDYIAAMTCVRCGGSYKVIEQSLINYPGDTPMDRLTLRCESCGDTGRISFDVASFLEK